MKRISTSATAEIPVSPAAVWALVSDVHRYAEWVEGTVEVTSGPATAVPGAVYTERNRVGPIISPSTWEVTEFDPALGVQRHVGSGSPGMRNLTVVIEVAPAGAGTCFTLTLEADVTAGALSGLLARLLRPVLARSNARSVEAFTALAVRQTASVPAS